MKLSEKIHPFDYLNHMDGFFSNISAHSKMTDNLSASHQKTAHFFPAPPAGSFSFQPVFCTEKEPCTNFFIQQLPSANLNNILNISIHTFISDTDSVCD